MGDVIDLSGGKTAGSEDETDRTKPGPKVIKVLKNVLERAETDGIANVFIVGVTHDDAVISVWANGKLPFTMVGGIENTKNEFMKDSIEPR